jgi:ATP-binding cassette subfamily B protein
MGSKLPPGKTQEQRSYDKQTLRIFWQATKQEKRAFIQALLFSLGSIFTTVLVPMVTGKILAALGTSSIHPSSGPGSAAAIASGYVPWLIGFAVAGVIFNRYGATAMFTMQARIMGRLQERSFDTLLKRSMSFHNNNVGGKLVSDALDYPSAYSNLQDALFTNIFPFVLVMVCGSVVVFTESWQLGLIVVTMCCFTIGSAYISTKRRYGMRMRRMVKSKEVTSHTADAIVNVPTIKAFANESMESHKQHKLNDELTALRVSDWHSGAISGTRRIAGLTVLQIIFVILLIRTVSHDPTILAAGIFAFSFIGMMSLRLTQLGVLMRQIEDGLLMAEPMTQILLEAPEIQDAPDAKKLAIKNGAIDLSNLTFRYDDSTQQKQVFNNLTLHIKPGERIGLVGPSGGGKSTLTRLLMRFEDIDDGEITIDEQNIAAVTQESLRKSIAYVPQEPLLFHRTVAENIAYGHPNISLQKIKHAAKQAYADEFIETLSEGYDTVVGERGVKLSGGQRQRIAIARAILKDAPILVLDEATSALDSESEVYIQKALQELMRGRTTIVIAHRLSTIQKMDRIIVLSDGKIVEEGSHKSLLGQKGVYARLWKHQSGGFIEE